MNILPVNEIFETIQGEAHWTGTPSVFIRLQGCDVGCPWCDTKHTWHTTAANQIGVDEMLLKPGDAPTFCNVSVAELTAIMARFSARHVVITGGEPCAYDLQSLTHALERIRCTVQIETSGTEEVRVSPRTWVTVSPKLLMPGGKLVRPGALERANEIKMPVGKPADIETLQALLTGMPRPPMLVWLQPLSQSPRATKLCVDAATKNGWRVSIQTHKFLLVR